MARLTVEPAAEYVGVSKSMLDKLRTAGGGPRFMKLGKKVLYDTWIWIAGASPRNRNQRPAWRRRAGRAEYIGRHECPRPILGHRRIQPRPRKSRNANRRVLRDRPFLQKDSRQKLSRATCLRRHPNPYRQELAYANDPSDAINGKMHRDGHRAGNAVGQCWQSIDVICGGFPCQDISVAGKGAGIAGERSGLWGEYARIVGEVRPRYVIVENVAALLGRGLERVLGDLAALGYDAEWHCIPASAVGAPHRRDRIWIVAYPGCASVGRSETLDQQSDAAAKASQGEGRVNGNGFGVALAAAR